MAEVAVLEGAGEEHAFARGPLQLFARRPEADDDGSRVDVPEGLEEQVDTLLSLSFPDEDDGRRLPPRNSASRFALPASGSRSEAGSECARPAS